MVFQVPLPWWLRRYKFACKAGDPDSMPGMGRILGEGNSYSLQYSSLENSMDRQDLLATIHEVAKSRTRLRD